MNVQIPWMKWWFIVIAVALVGVFAFFPGPGMMFPVFFSVIVCIWCGISWKEGGYRASDFPFLFLLTGTFIFGRAFSIMGIEMGSLPFYITEICLGGSLVMLVLLNGGTILKEWELPLSRGLKILLMVYFLLGTLYLGIGVKGVGGNALRDIVLCHYLPFMLVTLSFLRDEERIRQLLSLMLFGVVLVLVIGGTLIFGLIPVGSALRDFVKETKVTSFSLSYGLIFIFGVSFYGYLRESRRKRNLLILVIYLALLFIILYEVRAAWIATFAALMFLAILLKRESRIIVPVLMVVIASVVVIDYFGLTPRKGKLESIMSQVQSIDYGKQTIMPAANIRWRLEIWEQTFAEIKEEPVFGWGYGAQVDYLIWKKRLSWLKAIGNNSGILPPHNHLLTMFYKMGVVGLLLFIGMNLWVLVRGLRYLKHCQPGFNRRFLLASLVSLVYWHGMAFFFDILESPPTGIFLWIILACILAVVQVDKVKKSLIIT